MRSEIVSYLYSNDDYIKFLKERPYWHKVLSIEPYKLNDFKEEYSELVASVKSDEYYVNMMIAWYFATALAKQYDCTVKYIEQNKLDVWVHNKTIQKAVESYRISKEIKEYLKTLKIK